MPAESKAQLRWAHAHKNDPGKTGQAAREIIAKTETTKGLPARKKGKK